MALLILTSNESVGVSSGTYTVVGTRDGKETITVAPGTKVTLDASFNAGGDSISVSGNAGSYKAVADGTQVILTDSLGGTVTIPVGTTKSTVAFADASRDLVISGGALKLGNDTVGTTATTVTAGTGGTTLVVGQTFTLTTGVDGTFSGTNYTGGTGNDVFIAVDSSAGAAAWSALDAIDGGAGNDIFSVTTTGLIAAPTGAKVANIETLNLVSAADASYGPGFTPAVPNISLDTTSGYEGLTALNATGNGPITLTAAATTNVTVIDAVQSSGAIFVSGGKDSTITATAKDVAGGSAIRTGSITVGTSTAPAAGSVSITSTDTLAASGSAPSNITVLGGTGVTVSQTVKAGFALTAAASPTSTAPDGTAGTISVGSSTNPATGAVSITSDTNVTSTSAISVVGQSISVTGGSSVTVNQTASTTQSATGSASTVTLGAVSVTGSAATTSVSVSQPKAATGNLAIAASAATAAKAGTVGVDLVTAAPGVTGVTAVAAVNKADAVVAKTGLPTIVNGAVQIFDKNHGTTDANTITSVTLANYGTSTISSTALNTLNLSGGGGTLTTTEGGSTATVAANKTLTVNLGGGTFGVLTDSSNQFSTVNAVLTASSTLGGITDSALRTVNVSGTGVLSLTSVNSAITSITTTGVAGFNGDISPSGVTSFTGANSTANNTVTLNAATQSYTGGTGVDTVTVAANALVPISGGGGSSDVLVMAASVTPTAAGMKAKVSGFEILSTPSTSGTINMANMPSDIVTVRSTGASGGVVFTNVADGTALEITGAHSGGTTTYALAGTGGANKSVTVTLGGSTSDQVNFGTVSLLDVNSNGIGTVSLVSNGVNITTNDAIANFNTVALTNPGISTLNVSGTQGLNLGSSYSDSVTGLTINNSITGNYGFVVPNLAATSLDTLTFTGSGTTNVQSLNNGTIANLTITNSGTGKANVGQIYYTGTTDTNVLTSLTLSGNVTTGTKAVPLQIATTTGPVTVSGATDNAGVALSFTASSIYAPSITLGNGNNSVDLGATGSVVLSGGGTVTTGSGADDIFSKFATSAASQAWTIDAGAGDDAIYGGTGTSAAIQNVYIGGDGADYIQTGTGATKYVVADASAGKYAFVAFAGAKTTGSSITTTNNLGSSWTGTLYSEGSDTITSTGINQGFKDVMVGSNLINTAGAGKIFAGANIISNYYAQGAIAVASTAKDVFFFQTNNSTKDVSSSPGGVASSTIATGASIGVMNIEHFKIGQDIIAVTNYQNSGDNLFVGSAAAATAINAATAGEALLASANGWSWTLDLNSTTSGTLAYVGAIGASPTNANLSIHLIGVQGTIAGVDSFFYQG